MSATATKERPILFSGPMVREILGGTKTQTRRVVTPQPERFEKYEPARPWQYEHDRVLWNWMNGEVVYTANERRCPYGAPGDRLWVRESAWLYGQWWKDGFTSRGRQRWAFSMAYGQQVRYERPHDDELTYYGSSHPGFAFRPSIHMPRWASRLTLEITDVRVDRVQEITEEDAIAEGCARFHGVQTKRGLGRSVHRSARQAFSDLWDSLNAARGFGWDVNPWCWVLTFRRVENSPAPPVVGVGGGR